MLISLYRYQVYHCNRYHASATIGTVRIAANGTMISEVMNVPLCAIARLSIGKGSMRGKPSLLLVFFGVFINFVWQIFNVAGHFSFLKEEDPRDPLMSMLKKGMRR